MRLFSVFVRGEQEPTTFKSNPYGHCTHDQEPVNDWLDGGRSPGSNGRESLEQGDM